MAKMHTPIPIRREVRNAAIRFLAHGNSDELQKIDRLLEKIVRGEPEWKKASEEAWARIKAHDKKREADFKERQRKKIRSSRAITNPLPGPARFALDSSNFDESIGPPATGPAPSGENTGETAPHGETAPVGVGSEESDPAVIPGESGGDSEE